MIIHPILPIWLMIVLCVILGFIIIKNKGNITRRMAIIALIFMINLRPMIKTGDAKAASSNLDILFVIDNTISMVAEDYAGEVPRLTAVKKDTEYIMDKFGGSKFSIIIFNNNSQILTPFTKDINMTVQGIQTIQIAEELYATGSTPNIVLDDMIKVLKSSKEKENRKRIVFFISDGEITNNESLKSFAELKKYVDGGAVLGYGTRQGGYMKITDRYSGNVNYLEDKSDYSVYPYPKAVSKIDESNLKAIANDMGVDYINMSKQSNINSKISEIKKQYEDSSWEESKNGYTDLYFIFAVPLCALLVYEFVIYKKKL